MKIKVNLDNETVSIKGLTHVQFSLIEALVSHVRLGDGTEVSNAAFEILNAIETTTDLDLVEPIEINIGATTDSSVADLNLWLNSPMLVACEEERYEELDGSLYNKHSKSTWPFGGQVVKPTCVDCDNCDCGDD